MPSFRVQSGILGEKQRHILGQKLLLGGENVIPFKESWYFFGDNEIFSGEKRYFSRESSAFSEQEWYYAGGNVFPGENNILCRNFRISGRE